MVVVHVSNPELEKWRQKDKEFKISLGYMKTTLFNYQKKKKGREQEKDSQKIIEETETLM